MFKIFLNREFCTAKWQGGEITIFPRPENIKFEIFYQKKLEINIKCSTCILGLALG